MTPVRSIGMGKLSALGAFPTAQGIQRCAAIVAQGDYWWSPSCWMYSASDWTAMQQAIVSAPTNLAVTPPAGPPADVLTTPPASGQAAQQTVDQILAQTEANAQQLAVLQMSQVPTFGDVTAPPAPPSSSSGWGWIFLGAVVVLILKK